jgi:DNA invertase Pin-like site-specific DNA recombinase
MVSGFESDLIRVRMREGMATTKVRGKLEGRKPKLSPVSERHMMALKRHAAAIDSAVTLPRADA